jgi:5-methylcytosine-specific restriction enzyme A
MQIESLCRQCLADGKVTSASVADHNPPHNGDWNAFRLGPLQSLCADCHGRKRDNDARGYRSAIGDDGLPIDPDHLFNGGAASSADAFKGGGRVEITIGPPSRALFRVGEMKIFPGYSFANEKVLLSSTSGPR